MARAKYIPELQSSYQGLVGTQVILPNIFYFFIGVMKSLKCDPTFTDHSSKRHPLISKTLHVGYGRPKKRSAAFTSEELALIPIFGEIVSSLFQSFINARIHKFTNNIGDIVVCTVTERNLNFIVLRDKF